MSRKEIIGGCELYLGDCREILPTLSGIDHVITDPPYSDNTHKQAKTNRGSEDGGSQLITFDALSDAAFEDAVLACVGVAQAWVVMTCDYKHASMFYGSPHFVRLGAWVKPNPMPQISGDRPGQGFETVLILHAGKRAKGWNRGGGSGVWTVPVAPSEVPTQKPINLALQFVSDFTAEGETVLDPFMGGGTYGVACVRRGRRFVGIEMNQERFEIACRRIEAATKQPDLFIEAPAPKPKQLDLIEAAE